MFAAAAASAVLTSDAHVLPTQVLPQRRMLLCILKDCHANGL